jgi:hypothetical protein
MRPSWVRNYFLIADLWRVSRKEKEGTAVEAVKYLKWKLLWQSTYDREWRCQHSDFGCGAVSQRKRFVGVTG